MVVKWECNNKDRHLNNNNHSNNEVLTNKRTHSSPLCKCHTIKPAYKACTAKCIPQVECHPISLLI